MDYEVTWTIDTPNRNSKGNAWETQTMYVRNASIAEVRKTIMTATYYRFPLTGSAITVRQIKMDGTKKTVGDMMFWKGEWEWMGFPSHINYKVKKNGTLGEKFGYYAVKGTKRRL